MQNSPMSLVSRLLTFLCLLAALCLPAAPPVFAAADSAMTDVSEAAQDQTLRASLQAPAAPALRGPVDDAAYIVGPGDRFNITVWGQGVVTQNVVVTPEGTLVLPGVASVDAAGRTLREVKADVARALAGHYHDVEISVSLVGLRSMLVSVTGSVGQPGTYTATPLEPAGELIRKAGGLAAGASRRNIRITRRNGDSARVDLVRHNATGDVAANPPVLDGDVIFVPFAVEYVHVGGAVGAPGRYERVSDETVGSLLELAGGFARGAVTDSVEVRRFVNDTEMRSQLVDAGGPPGTDVRLGDGDQVYVREQNEWRRVTSVEVDGEVKRPGPYGINEGVDRLADVVRAAGGLTEEASLRDAMLIRTLPWGGPDPEFERLKLVPAGDLTEMELNYLRTRSRDRGAVVTDFAKALAGDPDENVLLLHGDRIVVPKVTRTVEVIGQVANPGEIDHVPGERYSYYVREAGGYSSAARRNRIRVIRGSTGESVHARRAGELHPGDTVWVPEKADADWWQVAREVAGFLTSIATVYIVIDQATSK